MIQMWEMKLCDLCNSCDTIFEIAKDSEKKNYAIKQCKFCNWAKEVYNQVMLIMQS
jgi:hypothetical protein